MNITTTLGAIILFIVVVGFALNMIRELFKK